MPLLANDNESLWLLRSMVEGTMKPFSHETMKTDLNASQKSHK